MGHPERPSRLRRSVVCGARCSKILSSSIVNATSACESRVGSGRSVGSSTQVSLRAIEECFDLAVTREMHDRDCRLEPLSFRFDPRAVHPVEAPDEGQHIAEVLQTVVRLAGG